MNRLWVRLSLMICGVLFLVFFMQFLGIAPVSYTHLRAHETVLDLVCRLLLEKKTTTEIVSDV